MLRVVNDNKLGAHVVRINVPIAPLKLDFPPARKRVFNARGNVYIPNFHEITIAYNPGEKPKPSNQYTNNYMKTAYKTSSHESAINSWFRL